MTVNGKSLLKPRKQLFVIIDFEVRMNAPLHQNAGTAEGNSFVNFFEDHMVREDVRFGIALHSVESTEGAEFLAYVGVVDVPVDNVTDHVVRMPPSADLIRR